MQCLGLVVSFCLLWAHSSIAQTDSGKVDKFDKSLIVPRYPDEKHLEIYRANRDYKYADDIIPPASPIEKWISWLLRKMGKLFSHKSYESFWQYVLMALAVGLFLFVLYKAKVLDYVFPSSKAQDTTDYDVGRENIHEINFEEAIGNALSQKDYRLAIRLQYLGLLKMLSNLNLIHWKPSLTNQSYIQELTKHPGQADFIRITRYFEFAWYGEFFIDEAGFKEMKEFSNSFLEKIKH